MASSFVPRIDVRVKPWKVKVGEDDTTTKITKRFLGEGGAHRYRELVAANMPHEAAALDRGGSVVLVLTEDEELFVPHEWPDPEDTPSFPGMVGIVGTVGQPVMNVSNPIFAAAAAAGQASGVTDPVETAAIMNAVVQWYANLSIDLHVLTSPVDMHEIQVMVTRAIEWYADFGNALPANEAALFPWAVLPLFFGASGWNVDFESFSWNADVPGTPAGFTWGLVPWDLLASEGNDLESTPSPIEPIVIPASGPFDPVTVRAAFQSSLDAAKAPNGSDPLPLHAHCTPAKPVYNGANGTCAAVGSAVVETPWCDDSLVWDAASKTCGIPIVDCGEGWMHQDNHPEKPCVPICKDPAMTWDPTDKSCHCPAGQLVNPETNLCVVPGTAIVPAPPAAPTKTEAVMQVLKPVLWLGGAALAVWGVKTLIDKSEKKKASST